MLAPSSGVSAAPLPSERRKIYTAEVSNDDPSRAADLERSLAERDPELLAAADEVDVTLLRWSLSLSPLERLRACTKATRALERLRYASTQR